MSGGRDGSWSEWADATARRLHDAERWRTPRPFHGDGVTGTYEGRDGIVSFASNDYLGLTRHPEVIAAAHAALDRDGAGSGSARLIVGARAVHTELEHELAAWKHEESAVVFPTGFAANIGTLAAFGARGTLVCSDELNHASIIDGCRLSRSDVAVYHHRDLDELAKLLHERAGTTTSGRAIVVSDTVFSMDGDLADIAALVALCAEYRAMLVLDEAHSVLGPHPDVDALAQIPHVRVGTLSKTLGALGGFVAGPRRYTDLLVNLARSYIFTTAPTPADTAAALAALRVLRSPAGDALVAKLAANVARLAPTAQSPIIPVMCGSDRAALDAAAQLLDRGFLVPAIRPPTVPPGTARLRIACSAAHTTEHVDALAAALADTGLEVHQPC
ncbi:MAG TPA: aminotransferase class I/II-fold pyridoxal phosphate-dependent enzyme [Acidimicrobiia bacterium]